MRRLIIPLMLASVAGKPAIAGPDDNSPSLRFRAAPEETGSGNDGRAERRVERRSERAERRQQSNSGHVDAVATVNAVARADRRDLEAIRAAQLERRLQSAGVSGESGRIRRSDGQARLGRQDRTQEAVGGGTTASEPGRTERRRRTGPKVVMAPGADGLRQSDRPLPRVLRDRAPLVTSSPAEGSQPPLRLERRRRDGANWATSWRRDGRYDWRRWRDRHRSRFRLGYYMDPFGWGYRPYSIGWRLRPSYYGSNYWIHDPWQYRLPYAPPGYRWIRYYDDAILIDTWDGRVVDVIHHFFW